MAKVVLESPATVNRRQPLLGLNPSPAERRGVGEVAGGAAAECAAVCCCFPCAVVKLVVLAVYKVPTGLCRKAWKKKKKRQRAKKKAALLQQKQSESSKVGPNSGVYGREIDGDDAVGDGSTAAGDFETEMWDRFYGAGFWRSISQREG